MAEKLDKAVDKELLKNLEEIGLTQKQARVYLALLPLQNARSSELIRATGLHGQFVYDSLDRLEELGLAKHAIQDGRKKFTANSPHRLLSLVDEKKRAAEAVAREIQGRFLGRQQQEFEVYQGDSAFIANELSLLEEALEGAIIGIIGGGGTHYMDTLGFAMNQYEKRRIEKQIGIRYISSPSQGPYLQIMAQNRANFEYKLFPNLQNGLVDTSIWDTKVTINLFGSPRLSFMIKSPEIADSYRQFFEALWLAAL